MINASLPRHRYGYVRAEFLHNLESHHGELVPCVIFGIASVTARSIGFHILMNNGAQYARVPIHAIVHKQDAPRLPLTDLALWDCFGYDVSIVEFTYLREMEVTVFLTSGEYGGVYIASLDWRDNGFSDTPDQHKVMHLIELDNGCFALQPNNRCRWVDHSFVEPFKGKPTYRVNTHRWWSEEAKRIEDPESYFYVVKKEEDVEETERESASEKE